MKKLILIPLLCGALFAVAQQAVYNAGGLQLHSGAQVGIFGNFTNASGAALVNNGSINLRANLTNNQASMSAGTGTLLFNGTGAQTVSGTQVFITNNLTTSNSNGITLNNNLQVNGSHTFTAGRIATGASSFLIYEAAATYSGAADARHVTGWVKKRGKANFTFPVGDGTYLRPVGLSNLTASSEFDVNYAGATTNRTNYHAPILSVDPNGQWNINRISGAAAQVTLSWDKAKAGFYTYYMNDITIGNYRSGYWENVGGTTTGTQTAGSITSPSTGVFGLMSIASRSFPVPLKFISVEAAKRNGAVEISWKAASEVAVARYEIERSTDGNVFSSFTSVAPRNSGNEERYSGWDYAQLHTKTYYRIRGVDHDGSTRYSTIVFVLPEGQMGGFTLVGNPVRNNIILAAHNGRPAAYRYELSTEGGALVRKGTFNSNGNDRVSLPVAGLPPGMYTLHIGGDQPQTFKLIIQ